MSSVQKSSEVCVRHVLLTGKPGIGKSTLVKKVCEELAQKGISTTGFYTEEIRQNNCRVGFDVVTLKGTRAPLARVSNDSVVRAPKVGKYSVYIKSFEEIAIPIFRDPVSDNCVLVIDEIGRMEMLSRTFCQEVKSVFTKSYTILATVPVGNNNLVKQLQSLPSALTMEVDYTTRNTLLESIVEILLKTAKKD